MSRPRIHPRNGGFRITQLRHNAQSLHHFQRFFSATPTHIWRRDGDVASKVDGSPRRPRYNRAQFLLGFALRPVLGLGDTFMADSPATRPSLLVRLRDARDGPAWEQFVNLYGPLIFRYGLRQRLQEADAADLTQEVLTRVARALPGWSYDPQRGAFRGWLFTIVRNQFRNVLERRRRQIQGAGDTSAQEALDGQPAPDDGAAWNDEYRRRLFGWAAEQVRADTEATAWQAFWLTGVEGQAAKDAAGQLGMTVVAVYMAKSRILARIKSTIATVDGEDEKAKE